MLDQIIKFSIKNKFIIAIMTLCLIIWGTWSASKLPIDAVPDITNNQVQIMTLCPTLASQEVEQLVTFPIEQSIANLPDIEETRSISRFGLSVITVVFKDNVDIYFARQLINEKLKEAEEKIPYGIGKPELAPVSTGLGEVYQYILHPKKGSENKYNAKDLRTMQDWIVARQLNGTPGIAEVNSFGGELKQYEVAVNPYRLQSMGVSIPDIFNALESNNENTGGAYIDKKPNAYFIRGIGLVNSIVDIENIVVKLSGDKVPIFIRDVAEVRFGHAVRYGALTYNGEVDAVGGVVMMLKGENSNEVVNRIKAKLPTIQKTLPDDVVIEAYLDRTDLVNRAISTVKTNLIEGALIVIFVLVVFLGNLRAGLIVASAIPLSMLFALGMMNVFGVSANLMSLGAIDFGLIVDGAVIIVEATLHHLGLRKTISRFTQKEMDDEVFISASRIRNSAAFGEIIILIVYIPILTLIGIEGKMFGPMAMTVGFAILGALILSLTYIPMMCALFLPKTISHIPTMSDKMMAFFHRIYEPLLKKAILLKFWLVGITVAIFMLCLWIFSRLGGEFIPNLNEGDFAFHCILPQGSSLSQSIETSMQACRIIKTFEEVKMVVGKTGAAEIPTDPMPPEATDMMIILKPRNEWKAQKSYDQLADEINDKLMVIPGVFYEKNQPIQMRFNELMTGIRQDVAVKIFGENLDSLLISANKVAEIVKTVQGATEPQVERVAGLPQINIEYDRNRMANYGLNIEQINDIVSTAFAGKTAGVVYENERKFDLVVRLNEANRTSIDDVSNLLIPTHNGNQIPLSQVATIDFKLGPAQISREDGKRRIVIGFNVKDRDVQSVVEEIQLKLSKEVVLPTGYYFTYGGTFENLQKASQRLMIAVPVSLLLIFVLLYFTFNSMKQASLIFTAIPMSAIGGVFALLIRDMPFSISAGIGFIALFGVAVLNGIVLIGTFNQLKKDGINDVIQRVMEGTNIRLRPVLMTATVASLGFLPMALSSGAGAEVQKPLATVVIGGLITATFLTLFVLPLLYILFDSGIKKRDNTKPINSMSIPIVFWFLLIPSISNSQIISIDEAVELAIKNNNTIKAKDYDILASQSLIKTAKRFPKLDFNILLGQYNSLKFDNAFQVAQTIPYPTLFKAKKELIEAEIKGKELAKEMSIVELKNQVRCYYHNIQYLQFQKSKLLTIDNLYNDFIKIAELRYKTGEGKKIEINTATSRKGEVTLLLNQNNVEIENAYSSFYQLLNTSQRYKIDSIGSYNTMSILSLIDISYLNTHPLVSSLLQEAKILDSSVKVTKLEGLPDFTLGYNNQSLIGFQDVNGSNLFYGGNKRFHSINVNVAIPLTYSSTKAKQKSLEYKKQSIEAEVLNTKLILSTQIDNTLKQYNKDLLQYEYYKTNAVPNSEEIVNAANLGYQTGDVNYIEYLYSIQMATDTQLKYFESINRVNQSVLKIYYLINQ